MSQELESATGVDGEAPSTGHGTGAPRVSRLRIASLPGGLVAVVGCLALATCSLFVLPRDIAYDPYSWLIWGREIAHLHLDTTGAATAVKPLPMVVTALLDPAGSLAPLLWLLLARTAALLSLYLAFRVGRRVGGLVAGVVATVGLGLTTQYLSYLFMTGMSEPIAAATFLAAVDNQLRSRRGAVFGWLAVTGLLRPEAWPFLVGYALWLGVRASAWRRVCLAAVAVVVPSVWFVIDWFGSGHLLRSTGASAHQSQGGPLLSREPGLAAIRETWNLLSGPIIVLFLLGLAVALVGWARTGRARPTVWLGLVAIGWLAIDAMLTQLRLATGAPRYLLPGAAVACVVAGAFVADCVRWLARVLPGPRPVLLAGLIGLVGFAALSVPRLLTTHRQVAEGVTAARHVEQLARDLPHAISLAGGRDRIAQCGPVSTQRFQVPMVAWDLNVPVGTVGIYPGGAGTVFKHLDGPVIPGPVSGRYRSVGSSGPVGQPYERWTVLTTCPPTGSTP